MNLTPGGSHECDANILKPFFIEYFEGFQCKSRYISSSCLLSLLGARRKKVLLQSDFKQKVSSKTCDERVEMDLARDDV